MLVAVDYASIDANVAPNFAEFGRACTRAGSSASIAIFRGAWGMSPDSTARRDWQRARDAGMTCGAYLYLRTRKEILPEAQVHVFADSVGALRFHDLVPILDVEDIGMTPDQEFEWVRRAWAELRRIYGAPPILYDSARVWSEDLHDRDAEELIDSPQWVAKPWPWQINTAAQLSPKPFEGGRFEPRVPKPWGLGNWWMHQYQGDAFPAPGFSNTVDLSRFNVMRQGETGARVRWVRQRLGMEISPRDGLEVFDRPMEVRIRAFQKGSGLVVDGIIGPKTFAAICWCNGVERPMAA